MKKILIVSALLLLSTSLLTACTSGIQQSINKAVMQTMVAVNVQSSQTAVAQDAIDQATGTALAAASIITPTPTVFNSPTPAVVWLTVDQNTNCRKGPAGNYDYVAILEKGTRVQSVARNFENNYYYVIIPEKNNAMCWVWAQYLTVEGDATPLPIFTAIPSPTPSPTPTPVPSFAAYYVGLNTCSGNTNLIIKIENNGGVMWSSAKVSVYDRATKKSYSFSTDQFIKVVGCAETDIQSDLSANEEGYLSKTSSYFNYDPTGHGIVVTITLFSGDGLSGQSLSQSLSFTP